MNSTVSESAETTSDNSGITYETEKDSAPEDGKTSDDKQTDAEKDFAPADSNNVSEDIPVFAEKDTSEKTAEAEAATEDELSGTNSNLNVFEARSNLSTLNNALGSDILTLNAETDAEATEDTTDNATDYEEPEQSKTYTSEYYVFAYKDGKWRRFDAYSYNEETSSDKGYELEDFRILDSNQGVYQYVEKDYKGKAYTYLIGADEDTEGATKIGEKRGNPWLKYKNDIYSNYIKYDSIKLTDKIYGIYDYELGGSSSINEPVVNAIVGWTEDDVQWQDPYKTLFLYDNDLYVVNNEDYVSAFKLHIEKKSEDGHIIWFTDPTHPMNDMYPDRLRMTGWNDSDITWINKEAGVFKLNSTDEFYLPYDEIYIERNMIGDAIELYFGSAYSVKDAEMLDGRPIVKFTWTGIDGYGDTHSEERIIGWTLKNVDYTVKINDIRLLKVGEAWYSYTGRWPYGFAQASRSDISSEIISDDIIRFTWNGTTYLSEIPKDADWIVSKDKEKGLFEYYGDTYLIGTDDSGLAVKITKVESTTGLLSADDQYLLNWTEKASPNGTFFHNGAWYRTEDNFIAKKIETGNSDEKAYFADDIQDSDYITYDSDEGWILKYSDGSAAPVKDVSKISSLENTFILNKDDDVIMIVGCQDRQFLNLCNALYYGKDGLDAFEYNGNKYVISSSKDIAIMADSEDDFFENDYIFYSEKESIPIIKIDKQNKMVLINGSEYPINEEQSTDDYTVFDVYGPNDKHEATKVVNWTFKDAQKITKLSYDTADYGFFYENSFYYEYIKKGEFPYTQAIYFMLDDDWYKVDVSDYNEDESIEGLPASRLDEGTFDANGVMFDGNRIIGINNITSGIRWIQESDFQYYDTTDTGLYRIIPAWFEYGGKYYVTYDGCSAYQVDLIDSENNVYQLKNPWTELDWFYSDWAANQEITWLTRSYDSNQHVSGWFIYNNDYYYTKDGKSANRYEKSIQSNVFNNGIFFLGNVDYTNWEMDSPFISDFNTYHSSKAVEYAKEHVADPVDTDDDCANFVSQCLSAGGLMNTDQWKPESNAWILVEEQMNYLQNYGNLTVVNQKKPDIQIGDPVYYDYNGDGVYDHVAICVSYDEETGKPIVYSHSNRYSKKSVKIFDEVEAERIATVSMPDLDEGDDTSAHLFTESMSQNTGHTIERPRQYLINWDISKADYYPELFIAMR